MSKPEALRFRFSVPVEDVSVREWVEKQHNLSMSVRQLIKDYIEANGYTDATCQPVSQIRGPGRPRGSVTRVESDEAAAQTPAEASMSQPVQAEPFQPVPPVQPQQPPKTDADMGDFMNNLFQSRADQRG